MNNKKLANEIGGSQDSIFEELKRVLDEYAYYGVIDMRGCGLHET